MRWTEGKEEVEDRRADGKDVCSSPLVSLSVIALSLVMHSLMQSGPNTHRPTLPRNPMMHLSQPRTVCWAYSHLPDESECMRRVCVQLDVWMTLCVCVFMSLPLFS